MPLAVVIPLVAFGVVAFAVAVVLRRAGRILAAARRDASFRAAVGDLATRADGILGAIVARVDAVRRHELGAALIAGELETARQSIDLEVEAAHRLPIVDGRPDRREEIAAELERAGRALDLVAHGCAIVAGGGGRSGDLEAQTSIKRGYLNLIHAREAVGRHAREAVGEQPRPPAQQLGTDHTM